MSSYLSFQKPSLSESLLSQVKHLVNQNRHSEIEALFLRFLSKQLAESTIQTQTTFISDASNTAFIDLKNALQYLVTPPLNLTNLAKQIASNLFNYIVENYPSEIILSYLRNAYFLLDGDHTFRKKIVQIYKDNYPNLINLDTLVHISKIDSADFKSTFEQFDKLVAFANKSPIYSSRFGYGEIIEFDFLLETITCNFFPSNIQTIPVDSAVKSFQVLPTDNFYYLKAKNPKAILKMLKDNPTHLLKIIQRDVNNELTSSFIKSLLSDIADKTDIKPLLILLRPSQKNTVRKLKPNQTLQQLQNLRNKENWQEQYLNLFFVTTDEKLMSQIIKELDTSYRDKLIQKATENYKKYPHQFLFVESFFSPNLINDVNLTLFRYLELAVKSKTFARQVRKLIISDKFRIINEALLIIDQDRAQSLWQDIRHLSVWYPEELDQIQKLFETQFPLLFASITQYTYHTQKAIDNKTQELKRLVNEEIPKVASELAQARSYGDLRENFEFKAAKEKQKRLFSQIASLKNQLALARPIDFNNIDSTSVSIGTKVILTRLNSNPNEVTLSNQQQITYSILGPFDSDLSQNIISYQAPFAQLLLGKKVGDEIVDQEGTRYKIIAINKVNG